MKYFLYIYLRIYYSIVTFFNPYLCDGEEPSPVAEDLLILLDVPLYSALVALPFYLLKIFYSGSLMDKMILPIFGIGTILSFVFRTVIIQRKRMYVEYFRIIEKDPKWEKWLWKIITISMFPLIYFFIMFVFHLGY